MTKYISVPLESASSQMCKLALSYTLYLINVVSFGTFTDVDECLNGEHGEHNCHDDAYCTNTKGAFNCTCHHDFKNLYYGNGTHCYGQYL